MSSLKPLAAERADLKQHGASLRALSTMQDRHLVPAPRPIASRAAPVPGLIGRVLGALGACCAASALAASSEPASLADFSLEDLSNLQITSVSGRIERLSDAPASIFVITADDIRRAGASSLPEALRLAPNLQVARASAYSYSITARGLNGAGNKLLVLIDGRIVYTPLYSGVLWYEQDLVLQDIERIEVISGPGATLWGSNAVNGVINVITRAASLTQGTLFAVSAGDVERSVAARYGGAFGSKGYFRVYGKGLRDEHTDNVTGGPVSDAWGRGQAGFRMDWSSELTLQADAYKGSLDQFYPGKQRISGANVMGRWTHPVGDGDTLQLQAYVDESRLDVPGAPGLGSFKERLRIVDLELQYNVRDLGAHAVTWGASYRTAHDRLVNSPAIAFLPDVKDLSWASLFAQDVVAINEDVSITAGLRAERNSYTGLELLPSLRISWNQEAHRLIWGEVSRAVRTPSRLDRDLYSPAQPPFLVAGGPNFRSETSKVIEIGLRSQPSPRLSYSITAFHHQYDHLRSVELVDGTHFVVANQMFGESTGAEAWASLQLTANWRITAGGVLMHQHLGLRPDSTDLNGTKAAANDPSHQWTVRSSLDLPRATSLDVAVRHVAALPNPAVPAYTAFDARLAWRPYPELELSLAGQNLFGTDHVEFGAAPLASVVPRSISFALAWKL